MDLEPTAFHEAGHAVAPFAVGRTFQHVTIVPDDEDESLGHVQWRRRRPSGGDTRRARERAYVLDTLVVMLAGVEAQAQFQNLPVTEVVETGAAQDD